MELDKSGAAFDAQVHYVKDGKGVLTGKGLWRKRGGAPKKEEASASVLARLKSLEKAVADRDAQIAALKNPHPELLKAQAELVALQKAAGPAPSGPVPNRIPYKGLVRATEDCHIGQLYKKGDLFQVDMPALWSDDPFVAVVLCGYNDKGEPQTEPNLAAPPQIDFRFRPRSVDTIAIQNAQPRRANEY